MARKTIEVADDVAAILTATRVGGEGQPATLDAYLQQREDSLANEVRIKAKDRRWDALTAAQKDAALIAGEST